MSLDGIWTLEFYGAFGWESAGVLMLEQGRALGGGNNHYARGTYALENDTVLITVEVDYFGTPRTMFGERETIFTVAFHGTRHEARITGSVSRPDKSILPLQFRLSKKADLSPTTATRSEGR